MGCAPLLLHLAWHLLVAFAVPAHASLGRCVIGNGSRLNLTLDASQGSLCCAAAQLYLARRSGGECPQVRPALQLPFGVRCAVDLKWKASMPDENTANNAHGLLCDLPGCWPAVLDMINLAKSSGVSASLPAPNCRAFRRAIRKKEEVLKQMSLTEKMFVVIAMQLAAVGSTAFFHCVVAPRWIRFSSQASMPANVPSSVVQSVLALGGMPAAANSSIENLPSPGPSLSPPVVQETLDQISTASSPVFERVPPPANAPPTLSPPPQALGVITLGTVVESRSDPEALAHSNLVDVRENCRAHIVLLCAAGIVATLVRVVLCAVGAVGPAMLFVILLCVYQLGSLARTSLVPLISPKDDECDQYLSEGDEARQRVSWTLRGARACSVLFGDLRVYSGTTVVCELFVISVLAAGFLSNGKAKDRANAMVAEHLGDDGPLSVHIFNFILSQAALSLVLFRLYTAWLAHDLHKLRVELSKVILPEALKASEAEELSLRASEAKKLSLEPSQSKLNAWMHAWEAPSVEEELPTPRLGQSGSARKCHCRAASLRGTRARAGFLIFVAMMLVGAAAAVGVWRAHHNKITSTASSCKTATRALDFCVQKKFIGLFSIKASHQDCCKACDVTAGCQAWSFQEGAGQCWMMSFNSAPCDRRPNDASCRCNTGADRISGFRDGVEDMATS